MDLHWAQKQKKDYSGSRFSCLVTWTWALGAAPHHLLLHLPNFLWLFIIIFMYIVYLPSSSSSLSSYHHLLLQSPKFLTLSSSLETSSPHSSCMYTCHHHLHLTIISLFSSSSLSLPLPSSLPKKSSLSSKSSSLLYFSFLEDLWLV